jgi:hypothetical protein
LVEEKEKRPNNHNSSLKRYNNLENSDSLILHPSVSASDLLNVSGSIVPPILQSNSGIKLAAPRYPIPTYGCLKGGVKPTYRDKKLGHILMREAIYFMKHQLGETKITISAQLYLKKFYESHGFIQTSEMYLEDDIPHIEMRRS